jgi:hypothetical protein
MSVLLEQLFSTMKQRGGIAVEKSKKPPDVRISQEDIESDFEYNFDLNPFNVILEWLHTRFVFAYSFLARHKQRRTTHHGRGRQEH